MAIKLTSGSATEALVYDNVFIPKIEITQSYPPDATSDPIASALVTYQLYAIDSNNLIHTEQASSTIVVSDIYSKAVTDTDLVNLMSALTIYISKELNSSTDLVTSPV